MSKQLAQALNLARGEARAWLNFLEFYKTSSAPLWPVRLVNLVTKEDTEAQRLTADRPDPQIYLGGVPRTPHLLAGPVLFEAEVEVVGPALVNPILYLDLGSGFNETATLALNWRGEGRLVGLIPEIAKLRQLRLDPSEQPCDLRLKSLRLRREISEPSPHIEEGLSASIAPVEDFHTSIARVAEISGVHLLGGRGIIPTAEVGVFEFTDEDPQIIFTTLPEGHGDAAIAHYEFDVEDFDDTLSAPRIYLDYVSKGYSHAASFPLDRQPDGRYRAMIVVPALAHSIRWDPSDRRGQFRLRGIRARPHVFGDVDPTSVALPKDILQAGGKEFEILRPVATELTLRLNGEYLNAGTSVGYDYGRWLERNEAGGDEAGKRRVLEDLERRPKFSFVTPTYNTPPELLEACVRSMLDQVYPDFEICIADDNSSDPRVREVLTRLAQEDDRIKLKFRRRNGHISEASNSALSLASGEYVVLVDHDDLVPDYCLLMVAAYLNQHPQAKVLYSDEDKIDQTGRRCDPYFKSDFNQFLMYGHNMVSHLGVYERALVKSLGGFRKGYEGSQDYDLFLRCLSRCGPEAVVHVPHVLYHWRMLPGSTAVSADQKSYAVTAAQKSLNDFFQRQGLPFVSVDGVAPGLTGLEITGPPPATSVSIVIPTRDGVDLLRACVASLRDHLDPTVEVLIIDNGSVEPETTDYLAHLAGLAGFRVIRAPGEFNFSALCNLGVAQARSEIICLLNNDTEVVADHWLVRARTLLSLPQVGIVGARLAYPDGTLQHFGLYLGMGSHQIAGTPHRGLPLDAFGAFGKARLIQEFSAVTAACLFVRRETYQAVGGFDPALPVAYNDIDFCLKVRAQGLKVVCDPAIVLIHKESKTRGHDHHGDRARRLQREADLMRQRWGALLDEDPYYSPNLTLQRDDLSLAPKTRKPLPWIPQTPPNNATTERAT